MLVIYPSFQVSSPALIKPKMLPRSIRDKVTTPAVSELMGNNVNVLSVLNIMCQLKLGK